MSGRKNPRLNIPIPLRQQTQLYRLPLPPQSTAVSKDVADLSDLERIQTLGHGSGGNVYKVRHSKTSALYALKVIQGNPDETVRRQIIREMEILKKTESPYIVKCHGIFEKGEEIHFVLEYMDGGSLEQRRSDMKSEKFLAQVARQVLEGLKYLHRHKIVHRDIKPSNLLINKKQEVKIADFGVSRILSQTLDPCNTYVGTCAYMSPERFDPETYGGRYDGYAGDIWSLGLSLLECHIGHFPFLAPGQKLDWPALMCAICYEDPPSPPSTASANFRSFINCCLHKDARNRWTAAQLLGHPFILSSYPQAETRLASPDVRNLLWRSTVSSSHGVCQFPELYQLLSAQGCSQQMDCCSAVGSSLYSLQLPRKAVSATAFTVTGVVNKFLTVVINVLIWDKHASNVGLTFLLMTIIGGVFYQQSVTTAPPPQIDSGMSKQMEGLKEHEDADMSDEEKGLMRKSSGI